MLLVLQKSTFIEKWGSATMRNYAETLIMAAIWYKSFWQNICPIENRNLWLPLQRAITWKREVSQPHVLIFFLISSISSTTVNIVISRGMFFRDDQKSPYFVILILALMVHGNFAFFLFEQEKFLSDLALMLHDNFVGFISEWYYFYFFQFFYFDFLFYFILFLLLLFLFF